MLRSGVLERASSITYAHAKDNPHKSRTPFFVRVSSLTRVRQSVFGREAFYTGRRQDPLWILNPSIHVNTLLEPNESS